MSRWRVVVSWVIAYALVTTACVTYEYEEEVFLEVDGSGRLRVSSSFDMLEVLHALDGASPSSITSAMSSRFAGSGFELESVRETEHDGRRFVHVQGTFAAWDELCARPAFAERECRLDVTDDELALYFSLPAPKTGIPDGVAPDALLALRFHFPSAVRYHNSRSDIERGNIIGWERTASEYFGAGDVFVEARFERRSVLATTVVILGMAVGAVLFLVAVAVVLMVRKGRRQLALEAEESLSAKTPTVQEQ